MVREEIQRSLSIKRIQKPVKNRGTVYDKMLSKKTKSLFVMYTVIMALKTICLCIEINE